jgi:hypothetical protein
MWLYVFAGFAISKRVTKVCDVGNRYYVVIIFTLLGLLQLLNFQGNISYLFLISFILAGIVISNMDSGLAPKGIVVFARYYRYEKIKSVGYEYRGDQLRMIFRHKNHDIYLFLKREDELMVKKFIKDFYKTR